MDTPHIYFNSACLVYELPRTKYRPFIQYLVTWREEGTRGKDIGKYPTKEWATAVADKMERKKNAKQNIL